MYFQIGLLTPVGLAAKNAILMVEVCMTLRQQAKPMGVVGTLAATFLAIFSILLFFVIA